MSSSVTVRSPAAWRLPATAVLMSVLLASTLLPVAVRDATGQTAPDHLVISELATGGASAADELIELYNPAPTALPLEGLELVYVTATGTTVSRRASWDAGAAALGPGEHLLVANELGAYAPIADAVYTSGIAATGGSVALRIQGATTAVDALGWGTAASAWLEGMPAPAPAAGASLERLPGGSTGSTQDTDSNAADFIERPVPDPQNTASAPVPGGNPTPSPVGSASASPSATPRPTATPSSPVISVSAARGLPDGATATVEATAITDSAFGDGGGYVADGSGGIAVLLASGTFERGARLRITGSLDDRFAQRTLRATADDIVVLGPGVEPAPVTVPTGAVAEPVEGGLVRLAGKLAGAPTQLSAGLAFEVDDGSGAARVLIGPGTGIDAAGWLRDATIEVVGVVGQRDSSGTGTAGYRVQPRDTGDVLAMLPPSSAPDPSASATPSDPGASPTPPAAGVSPIAAARALPRNARVTVRGTVTMAPGVVDPVSAVIQDGSGAIMLRVGEEVGPLSRGERIEVAGARSSLGGMETLRVTSPARRLGNGAEPAAVTVRTGDAGEALESQVVRVRGSFVAGARRAGSGSVSFEVDDGSGPLRVYVAAPLDGGTDGLDAGAWVDVIGILGQETTGAQPLRGYRVWPRAASDVRVTAPSASGESGGSDGGAAGGGAADGAEGNPAAGQPDADLADLDAPDLASLRVGATLVHGPWPELGLGGVLWDGTRLVGIGDASADAVEGLVAGSGSIPAAVEMAGLVAGGREPVTGVPIVQLGHDPGDATLRNAPPDAPATELPRSGARWISVVGRLIDAQDRPRLVIDGRDRADLAVALELRCKEGDGGLPTGTVRVVGVALAAPPRIVVPCDGVRSAPALAMLRSMPSALPPAKPLAAVRPGAGMEPVAAGGPRVAAALLLAIGALIVGAAAIIGRRLMPTDTDADTDAHTDSVADVRADTADATAILEPDQGDSPGPRTLTLVPVPHERGSP